MEQHPIMNAVYDPSGAIKYNDDINVAMAVALDGGLITPTIKKANTLDIYSVGRVWKVRHMDQVGDRDLLEWYCDKGVATADRPSRNW